jgi:transcriptional regulator with XRE-family HTH domain
VSHVRIALKSHPERVYSFIGECATCTGKFNPIEGRTFVTNIFDYIGKKIRDLRTSYAEGEGLSQEALAKALNVATNTISRWETATYHPSLDDLDRLARFFGVSILHFFPPEQIDTVKNDNVMALLRVAQDLDPGDLEELRRYAEWRRARGLYESKSRPRSGRKRKEPK